MGYLLEKCSREREQPVQRPCIWSTPGRCGYVGSGGGSEAGVSLLPPRDMLLAGAESSSLQRRDGFSFFDSSIHSAVLFAAHWMCRRYVTSTPSW